MKATDILGLFAIMGGLVLYRFGASLCPKLSRTLSRSNSDSDIDDISSSRKEKRQPLLDVREQENEHTDPELGEKSGSSNGRNGKVTDKKQQQPLEYEM
jgi:hypothetical protein